MPNPYAEYAHFQFAHVVVRRVARVHTTFVDYSVKGVLISPLSKSIHRLTPGGAEYCRVTTPVVSRPDDYSESVCRVERQSMDLTPSSYFTLLDGFLIELAYKILDSLSSFAMHGEYLQ